MGHRDAAFSIEKGALNGSQLRFDAAADGKAAVKGHQAVIATDVPVKPDSRR